MEETQDLRVLNTNSVADKVALCIAPDHLGYSWKNRSSGDKVMAQPAFVVSGVYFYIVFQC